MRCGMCGSNPFITAEEVPYSPKAVAARWEKQYFDDKTGKWKALNLLGVKSAASIHRALLDLPDDASREDIDAIIGNDSWTTTSCDLCFDECTHVVKVNRDEYDTRFRLCQRCATDIGAAAIHLADSLERA